MYYVFKSERGPFAGFAGTAARAGESARVIYRELVSSEDGALLDNRLEAVSQAVLSRSPTPVRESAIDHFFALVSSSGETEVWINEPLHVLARTKRPVAEGQAVRRDDLADIVDVIPVERDVPVDVGFLFMFSCGWRRGLYYDLSPVHGIQRTAKSWRVLGAAYAYVFARSRFSINEAEWQSLMSQRWFPFTSLPELLVERMISTVRAGWSVDDLLPEIVAAVRSSLEDLRAAVRTCALLVRHREVISQCIEAFEHGKFAIAAQALMPKIEGILREHQAVLGLPGSKPEVLATSAARAAPHEASLLLPERLKAYLTNVFFAFESFSDPSAVKLATRHSVSHGVAGDEILTEKTAVLALLILHQLVLLIGAPQGSSGSPEETVSVALS